MRQLETSSLSNQNISAFLLAHTYTADADRAIFARIHIDQAAGGGDYQIYATIQAGGAGSAFMEGPVTTFTVPAAITSIGFVSILIPVNSGDVVKFYVKGLAGDVATPDIVSRIFELTYLRPTTPGRTLDVAATGEAGVDLDNIKDASAPKTLTNITVPVVTTVTNQQDVLTPLGVVDGIVDAILEDTGTTLPAAINTRATPEDVGGTVTVNATVAISSTVAAAVATGSLAIEAGYTFRQTVTSDYIGDLSAATKIWLAIKKDGVDDNLSEIFIEKTAGLTRVNRAAYTVITNGSLTVTGVPGNWSITIFIDETATALLFDKNSGYSAGIKAKIGDDVISIWDGHSNCSITDGVVRTV